MNFHFTGCYLKDWSGVDYLWFIVMFLISCLDSHSDGTHSLKRIHWCASDVMLYFYKSVLIKKQTHLEVLSVNKLSASFHFWVNNCFSFLGFLRTFFERF